MERFITDADGERTAVVLSIEEFETLVRAAEDAEDARAVDEVRAAIALGEDELIDYRQAREEWRGGSDRRGKTADERTE